VKLWRISNYADLKGIGGLRTPGRWHNRGIPVIYLSESPALAMLEVLVHFEMDSSEVPSSFQLLEIEFSGRKGIARLDPAALPEHWRDDIDTTRSVGDEWLVSFKSALLKVPSAVVPHSSNYLLNPRHELAQNASVITAHSHPYDGRLF